MRTVLVTGCSSGFGELIARTLAAHGYHVFATMRDVAGRNAENAERLRTSAENANANLEIVEMDVTDDASVNTAVEHAGSIDVVVNNAGASAAGPMEAFSIGQMASLLDINVLGPMRVNKAVLPAMRARRSGLIIWVTSTLGRVLPGGGGLYPATKWAAEGFAESLHYELRRFGVELSILEPGAFPTPAISKSIVPEDETVAREYRAAAPAEPPAPELDKDYRLPDLQEVADAVLHLVQLPVGERPLRTVVGPIFTEGVVDYNQAYERLCASMQATLARPDQAVPWAAELPRV